MFGCDEMIEGDRKEVRMSVWLEEKKMGSGGVFSLGPPFKRKKFSPQFGKKTREKSGE